MSKRIFSFLLILALLLPAAGALAAPVGDGGSETEVDSDIGFRVIPEALNAAYRTRVGDTLRIRLDTKHSPGDRGHEFTLIGDNNLQHGILRFTGERGVYTYHPISPGVETFTFTVTLDGISSEPATVTITVENHEERPLEFVQYRDMVNHWGAYSAGRLATLDLVVGQKADEHHYFYPNKAISRADFLIWLLAVMGIEPTDGASTLYADRDIPQWMVGFVDAGTNHGIIEGVAAGHPHVTSYFYPHKPITRIEAMKMVSMALGVDGHDENLAGLFRDVHEVPSWAKNHVRHLSEIQLITGSQAGNLRPRSNLTRAEAAELLYKAFKEMGQRQQETKLHSSFYHMPMGMK